MLEKELQALCERGQIELMETRYLDAADTLAEAEQHAWDMRSFDTLARLYLPLQEARRQIRQRCGEGAVRMHLYPTSPNVSIDAQKVLKETPHGQLLVAGWNTIEPAVEIRRLAHERRLYVETFLGSVQMDEADELTIQIFPRVAVAPKGQSSSNHNVPLRGDRYAETQANVILKPSELPADAKVGNAESFADVMALWERLHTPLLNLARNEPDPLLRMQCYRETIRTDPACELAHQYLAQIARDLARMR